MTEDAAVRSSYKNSADFGAVLSAAVFAKRPLQRIAEYGILDGFSLDILERCSPPDAIVEARDIFDDFKGHYARPAFLRHRFGKSEKVQVMHGDFYEAQAVLQDGAYDLIHVDIANTGSVYEAAEQLVSKLAPGGLILLEGGTEHRDQVPWMREHHKAPMAPVVARWREEGQLEVQVLGEFPGLTVIRPAPQLSGNVLRRLASD